VRNLSLLWALLFCAGVHAFDLQGHRGARGLLPENTLPAFERALDLGVTTLELDIAITSDGVLVIHHDPTLNPNITRDEMRHALAGNLCRCADYNKILDCAMHAAENMKQV